MGVRKTHLMREGKHIRYLVLAIWCLPDCMNVFLHFLPTHPSATFLFLFHYILAYTSTIILMGAILHFLMSCVVCIYYVTWQDHLLDPKILGSQHVSSPYTTFAVALRNNQTHIKDHECFFFTLLHVSRVIRSMGTNSSRYGSSSTTIPHISRVLYLYALNFDNVGSLSMPWNNTFSLH